MGKDKAEKSPAYQRYPKQILGDDKVLAMEWDSRGMHNWLLDISWQQEPRGTIPADHAVLRRWLSLSPNAAGQCQRIDLCRCPDCVWRRVWPQISPAWPIQPDGRLGNNGMIRTAIKQDNYSKGNVNKGAAKVTQTVSQIVGKPLEDEDEKELAVDLELPKPKVFGDFNGEMWVKAILNAHPLPNWGQHTITFVLDAAEIEAKENGWSMTVAAEYLHERSKLYAQFARTPGTQAHRATCGATKFFQDKIYRQDEAMWRKPADGKEARPIEPGIRVHRPEKVDPEELEKIRREGDAVIARLKAKRVGA